MDGGDEGEGASPDRYIINLAPKVAEHYGSLQLISSGSTGSC